MQGYVECVNASMPDRYPKSPYYTNEHGHQIPGSPEATADAVHKEDHERARAAARYEQTKRERARVEKARNRVHRFSR